MKASELRIGNLVNTDSDSLSVHGINQDFNEEPYFIELKCTDGMFIECNIEDIKPIPLTEEWLVKFGWGKGEYDTEYQDNVSLKQEVLCYTVMSNMFIIESHCDCIEIDHIKYVHQLQNIYFSLTGKELTT
jgi:hypothetical protein